MTFQLIEEPSQDITNSIYDKLESFNEGVVPTTQIEKNLAVVKYNDNNELIAGCYGRISWGFLYVDCLWVDDQHRGENLGEGLLTSIEKAAMDFGYNKAHLWTTSFQALDFYTKLGYQRFGELSDRPPGHTTYFLKKDSLKNFYK